MSDIEYDTFARAGAPLQKGDRVGLSNEGAVVNVDEPTKPKAYLAAPIFTAEQLAVVNDLLGVMQINGFDVFSPYHASQAIWKGRAPKDCEPWERAEVLAGNVANLNDPTRLLVSWVGGTADGKVDTGVAWEMGYFHNRVVRKDFPTHQPAGGPPLSLRMASLAYIHPTDVRQNMNLMLAGTVHAVAKGMDEFGMAMLMYAQNGLPTLQHHFNPDRHIAHEKDPIV